MAPGGRVLEQPTATWYQKEMKVKNSALSPLPLSLSQRVDCKIRNDTDYCTTEQSKEAGKDQEKNQSNTTPGAGHHMGKWHKRKKTSHTREPRGHPFPSGWPQGCKEQTIKYHRQFETHITQRIHRRSTALERSVKKYKWFFLETYILMLIKRRPPQFTGFVENK